MILYKNIKKLYNAFDVPSAPKAGKSLSEVEIIENAYIISDNMLVFDFGRMEDLHPDINFEKVIDCQGSVVIPAYVDSHTHLVFPKTREEEFVDRIHGLSYEEIAKRGGGILNTSAYTAIIDEELLFDLSYARLKEVMAMGTGAIEIKSGYGLTLESELKLLHVANRLKEISPIEIKTTFLGAHAVPKGKDKTDYVNEIINEMIPEVARQKLADYCDVFCDRGFFSVEDTDRILNAAAKYGMKAKIHANELDYSGGIQVGVKNNAISVDHLEFTGTDEIQSLRNSRTIATLLPSTAFFLGLEYPPARTMIEEGLTVSLASDYNPGSSPSGNMNFIMSLACIDMKMTPEEALNASTINSAHALEMGNTLGGIYKNQKANFIITEKAENLSYLPYSFGRPVIKHVVLNGEII